ncbi:FecR family protein [Asticcacaulis sp. W401b]|uniref:FecR family protein n=1 Tax=Asticcacaulis sp. W401b TaxID=3388666 RepID=UPI0039707308
MSAVDSTDKHAIPTRPDDAADWWFARQATGSLSTRDQARFIAWLDVAENAEAYARVCVLVEELASFAAEPAVRDLRQAALAAFAQPKTVSRWRLASVAAAFILGLSFLMIAADVIPNEPAPNRTVSRAKRYATEVGGLQHIRLDDGSMVHLNTDSEIEVNFSRERRDIRLIRGEALFEVAHNASWPFVVTAGDRHVTAVGTAFNVRLQGKSVDVVLVEGKVRVEPMQRTMLQTVIPQLAAENVVAGQQLRVEGGDERARVNSTDVGRAVSWRDGQLIFREDRLSDAVAEINRYSKQQILVTDDRVANLSISGVFNTTRPENFVAAITHFYPVSAEQTAAGTVELQWKVTASAEK